MRRFHHLLVLVFAVGCVDRQNSATPIIDARPAIVDTLEASSADASRLDAADKEAEADLLTRGDLVMASSTAETGVDAPADLGGDLLIRDSGSVSETSGLMDLPHEASPLLRCQSNAQGKVDGLACPGTAPSCYALGAFTCFNQPQICTCKGGVYVCGAIAPDFFSDRRDCNPEWECTGESKPYCGGGPGPYGYRCEKGKWTFYDGCANSGCYRPPGPLNPSLISPSQIALHRIHTGDTCPAKGDCRFAPPGGFNGFGLITCRCQDGRFACEDEPTPPTDGGVRD